MKLKFIALVILIICLSAIVSSGQKTIKVPANETLELEYNDYTMHKVTLKNKSRKGLSVKVLDKATGKSLRGFGLGRKGSKVNVLVEKSSKLVLKNNSNKPIKLSVKVTENVNKPKKATKKATKNTYVSFTLHNSTAKSIPLYIPSVMNPNLSPFSNSGVSLKMGQKIKFKHKLKKYTLLVVDESIEKGVTLNVAKLLKERKKELGLK